MEGTSPYTPSMQTRARVSVLRDLLSQGQSMRVCVVGGGKSGLAAAELVRAHGARVDVLDDVAEGERKPFHQRYVDASDLVVLSPGVPRSRPELASAIEAGKVVGEVELASWFSPCPLVGVTGTNGKSTTTALLGHALVQAGWPAFIGGNLGTPLSELGLRHRDQLPPRVAIVEVSSYQLESLVEARFKVGVWLNLTPDHMDRYRDVEEYALAKRRIIELRSIDGTAVLNAKDPTVTRHGVEFGGPARWFSGRGRSDLADILGTSVTDTEAVRRVDHEEERYSVAGPGLPGPHNRENAAAAIEALRFLGLSPEHVQRGLDSFPGLPHRLETIPTRDGRRWVNDSKATNIDAAVIGVRGIPGPKVLLVGGRDKGGSWSPLVEAALAGGVQRVIGFGEATPIAAAAFEGKVPFERVTNLSAAVETARRSAGDGCTVLLSPACSSFDQFRSYEARGDAFRALVQEEEA